MQKLGKLSIDHLARNYRMFITFKQFKKSRSDFLDKLAHHWYCCESNENLPKSCQLDYVRANMFHSYLLKMQDLDKKYSWIFVCFCL